MEKLNLTLFIMLSITVLAKSQCDCVTRKIGEHTIRQCEPTVIYSDNSNQIMASIQEVNGEKFVLITVRFRYSAEKINSNLQLFTKSESILRLELAKSAVENIDGNPVCHAQFKLTENDLTLLKKNIISSIRFYFNESDGYKTFTAQKNSSILKTNLYCLN